MARLRIHPNIAAALLDDSVAGGKPEPGAMFLGGEERLEDMRQHPGIHADSGIGHGEHRVLAGGSARGDRASNSSVTPRRSLFQL